MATSIRELMLNRLPAAFVPEQAQALTATIQFDFGADGEYAVFIADGKCSVREGRVDQPDATMATNQDTYLAIAEGRTNAMTAFMTGKLRVSGNLPLLMRFQQIFGPLTAE